MDDACLSNLQECNVLFDILGWITVLKALKWHLGQGTSQRLDLEILQPFHSYQTVINSTLHIFNKTERKRGIRIGDSESLLNTQFLLSYSVRLSGFFPCPPNLHIRYER